MTLRNGSKATLGRFLALVTGLIFLGGCGGSSSSSTTSTPAANNTAAVTVGFGPLGATGGYVNGIFTSVTVCAPGTSNCETVDNVLVDTGSAGLRILNSALTTVPASSLGTITDSNRDQLQECVQFGDTSFAWGPMLVADVELAGEKASSVPIQVIGDNSFAVPSQCLATPVNPSLPNGGNEDTVATLGANGILGLGGFGYPLDCGSYCTSSSDLTQSGYPYYVCPAGQACSATTVPTQDQATNPVAAFSSADNNGVLVTLPSIPATGAANGTVSGSLIFGIGTQSDNALASSATVYALDEYGNIAAFTYNGISYTSPTNWSVLDTGSSYLAFLDANTLASVGIIECADAPGLYCPTSTIPFTVTALVAINPSGTGTMTFNIMNADTLFNTNNAAFNDLGGDSGTSPANDFFDFGLPFFFGRSVYIGMMPGVFTGESSAPSGAASATNGYYAF
ncbi:MAG: DUF3443 family protein [Terriglobia bacterium]|jgi:hypothetical protein